MNNQPTSTILTRCKKCGTEYQPTPKFCEKCGTKLHIPKAEKVTDSLYNKSLIFIAIIYVVELIILFINHFVETTQPIKKSLIWSAVYSIFVIVFACLNWQQLKSLFSIKKLKLLLLISVVLISIVWAVIVHFYIDLFLGHFGFVQTKNDYLSLGFVDKLTYFLFLCFTTVIVPAFTEEILTRGVLYNYFKNIINEKSVIYITAILFAITHFSIISATWIIFSGLFYAYLRYKTNNLWYGIAGHFTHNLVVSFILVYYI